jgi:dipeptidyl aminopeptidase/acylaminoacyl peptidase
VPSVLAAPRPGIPGGGAPATERGIPGELYVPWLWQATVRQWAPGPAAVLFFTGATRYLEDTGVVVGRDGAYRLLYMDIGEDRGLLSPDGRYYARSGPYLLDLATGDERRLGDEGGIAPLAWSPDGRWILATRDNDDATITYGADGQPVNDPSHPDDLLVLDVVGERVRTLAAVGQQAYAAAAYAPDGARVAVTSQTETDEAQRLAVIDVATGRERWSVDLGQRRLGGTGAWSPDGERLAILAFDGCTGGCDDSAYAARRWRVEFLDAETGASARPPIALPGRPVAVLGWRSDVEPVLTYTPAAELESRHVEVVALRPDGETEPLVETADEVTGLDLPRKLVDGGQFHGGSPRPSPFAAQWWAYPVVGVPALLVVLVVLRALRRRTRPGH